MAQQRLGQYSVTRLIGQGGMGRVYEATAADGTRVAVKVLVHAQGAPQALRNEATARFGREARAAQSLNHPNIVSVLDVGEEAGNPFIVMELIEGETVRDLINMAGSIRLERALEIMTAVCDALGYAHDNGVVHRDIKPDNIMLLRDGRVKLTDFGLAIVANETTLTRTGSVMGTFHYMSPEQVRGEKVDLRSDIFSLGVTLYEMLSGRKAFDGDTPAAIIEKILNEDPPPPEWLPSRVGRMVNLCLRKNPKYRFQSAAELLADLRSAQQPATDASAPRLTSTALDTGVVVRSRQAASPRAQARAQAREARAELAVTTKCPRCGERWVSNTLRCWKCDLPDPRRRLSGLDCAASNQIADALRHLARRKKKWWQVWR